MKNLYSLVVFSLLFTQFGLAQIDSKGKSKEYTDLKKALSEPELVFRLDLSGQNINLENQNFVVFKNLEYLYLKNDHLKSIPKSISQLSKLKVLDLSGNDFIELSDDFYKLTNLEELYLNKEKNINLPKTLRLLGKLPNLRSLHLENDNLNLLPVEIKNLQNLEFLYLNQNSFKEIPKEVRGLDHLQYLDLKNNKIAPTLLIPENINFGFKINL
jgi:Leucine-rich repeat (LRR) protein